MGLDYTCIHDDDDGLDKYVDPPRVELIIDGEAHRHSALPFFKFSDAKTEIVKLNSLANFSFVAKALYPLKDKYRTDADDAIALIEPVSSLKTWLKNNKDFCFWEYNDDRSQCILIGKDFIRISFQIARAIEKIHKAKMFHNNLKGGIMMGLDNQVRVCNFLPEGKRKLSVKEYAFGQRKNLIQFISILQDIAQTNPSEKGLPLPFDMSWYFRLLNFSLFPDTMSGVEETSRWFFHAPIYWKTPRKLLFLDQVNEHLDLNVAFFSRYYIDFFRPFRTWKKILKAVNDQTITDCFNYGSPLYATQFGIIRFIKNYKKHHRGERSEAEAALYIISFFPYFLEKAYHEVFLLKHRDLKIGSEKSKKFGTIIWEDPSMFDMDGCRS